MLDRVDVLHGHNDFKSIALVERSYNEKPAVMHYHGTAYRDNPDVRLQEQRKRGAIGLVSTLDLYMIAPDQTEWLPAAYDVDWLQSMRPRDWVKHRTGGKVRIAHAPTVRAVKNTRAFLAAYQRLEDEGFPVELELIENASWHECLRRKAISDIFFDQVQYGYGCNALEAWGMGLPVIAGVANERPSPTFHGTIPYHGDETLDEMERRFGHLPFYHATEETIYDALKELVESPELRAEYGRIGHAYVRAYHDEPVVVEQLKGLYLKAAGQIEQAA